MTGSHTQNRVFSRLTLALMEDTGWYHANYSHAQGLDWGRGLGCDFVMKSCKFWMDGQRQRSGVTSIQNNIGLVTSIFNKITKSLFNGCEIAMQSFLCLNRWELYGKRDVGMRDVDNHLHCVYITVKSCYLDRIWV